MRFQAVWWVAVALATTAMALSAAQAAPGDKIYVQHDDAAIHAGPGAGYEILARLPKGLEVIEFQQFGPGRHETFDASFKKVVYEISEEDGHWTSVGVPGGGEGWLRSSDLGSDAGAAAALPSYDTEVYCAEVAKMSGGSYMIEQGCRDMEASAQALLEARTVEPKIMEYCDQVAQFSGGSYSLLDGCITMEEQARNAMKSN